MTKHPIAKIFMLSAALSLGACDKGGDAKPDGKVEAKAKTDGKHAVKTPGDAKTVEDGGDAPAEDVLDERVVKAAGLAKKIEAEPTRADEILAEAGMDRVSFDALIYEVSTPELAEQYRLARAREDG